MPWKKYRISAFNINIDENVVDQNDDYHDDYYHDNHRDGYYVDNHNYDYYHDKMMMMATWDMCSTSLYNISLLVINREIQIWICNKDLLDGQLTTWDSAHVEQVLQSWVEKAEREAAIFSFYPNLTYISETDRPIYMTVEKAF